MIVLDTHVLIWDALAPQRLSDAARQAIAEANQLTGVIVCDITLWEIAMLIEKRRLRVDVGCQEFITLLLQANKTIVQAITPRIGALAVQLPDEIGRDPADRLIAATTHVADVPLVTADSRLLASKLITTLW